MPNLCIWSLMYNIDILMLYLSCLHVDIRVILQDICCLGVQPSCYVYMQIFVLYCNTFVVQVCNLRVMFTCRYSCYIAIHLLSRCATFVLCLHVDICVILQYICCLGVQPSCYVYMQIFVLYCNTFVVQVCNLRVMFTCRYSCYIAIHLLSRCATFVLCLHVDIRVILQYICCLGVQPSCYVYMQIFVLYCNTFVVQVCNLRVMFTCRYSCYIAIHLLSRCATFVLCLHVDIRVILQYICCLGVQPSCYVYMQIFVLYCNTFVVQVCNLRVMFTCRYSCYIAIHLLSRCATFMLCLHGDIRVILQYICCVGVQPSCYVYMQIFVLYCKTFVVQVCNLRVMFTCRYSCYIAIHLLSRCATFVLCLHVDIRVILQYICCLGVQPSCYVYMQIFVLYCNTFVVQVCNLRVMFTCRYSCYIAIHLLSRCATFVLCLHVDIRVILQYICCLGVQPSCYVYMQIFVLYCNTFVVQVCNLRVMFTCRYSCYIAIHLLSRCATFVLCLHVDIRVILQYICCLGVQPSCYVYMQIFVLYCNTFVVQVCNLRVMFTCRYSCYIAIHLLSRCATFVLCLHVDIRVILQYICCLGVQPSCYVYMQIFVLCLHVVQVCNLHVMFTCFTCRLITCL